jgi:hypothetical protein
MAPFNSPLQKKPEGIKFSMEAMKRNETALRGSSSTTERLFSFVEQGEGRTPKPDTYLRKLQGDSQFPLFS